MQDSNKALPYLLRQRAAISRRVNAFMPAFNLPPEVLSTIFEFACCPGKGERKRMDNDILDAFGPDPDPDYQYRMGTPKVHQRSEAKRRNCVPQTTPMLLSAVCSKWRSVAHGTSQLWNSIEMRVSSSGEGDTELLRYWLSHSGQQPLSVKFTEEDYEFETPDIPIIDVVVAYAHQLHALDLFVPQTWQPALIQIGQRTPLLTRLALRGPIRSLGAPAVKFTVNFANVPRLREAMFSECSIAHISLPWSQLERVKLCMVAITECVELLRLCPQLRHLKIESAPMRDEPINLMPVSHPKLEVLQLYYLHSHFGIFLEVLTLPALRSLVVGMKPSSGIRSYRAYLVMFLQRSGCVLETLHWIDMMPYDVLVDCVRAVPTLRELHVYQTDYDSDLGCFSQEMLDLMNPKKQLGQGRESYLLPNLEILYYDGRVDFTPHKFVEFLADRYRWFRGASDQPRLCCVEVSAMKDMWLDDPDAALLQKLRREGVDVEFPR